MYYESRSNFKKSFLILSEKWQDKQHEIIPIKIEYHKHSTTKIVFGCLIIFLYCSDVIKQPRKLKGNQAQIHEMRHKK